MNGNKIVIGIDQSYKCTGIAVYVYNSETKKGRFWKTFAFTPKARSKARARWAIANEILTLIIKIISMHSGRPWLCFERPRLFSKGHISAPYLLSVGALNGLIIDRAGGWDIPCYSVDTRAWRCAAVGNCKRKDNNKGIPPEKYYTVKHFCKAGYKRRLIWQDAEGQKRYEHDIADAMGIAVAAARLEGTPRLKKEN